MARPLRIEFAGAVYHITARGNEGITIYRDKGDYSKYLEMLAGLSQKYGVVIHGYVLMGNHYHLLLETPTGNLTKAMHYLNAGYTSYFNRRHGRTGHVLQGRYQGLLIEKVRYLLSVSGYIHLNPWRAGIAQNPEDYQWSSYAAYLGKAKRPEWLTTHWILSQYSNNEKTARTLYREFVLEGMRGGENPFEELNAGIILGADAFVARIRETLKRHREVPESRRIVTRMTCADVIQAVAQEFDVSDDKIRETRQRHNQARKVSLYLLNRLTDMSNEEIARNFGIGYTAVSQAALRLTGEMEMNRRLASRVKKLERHLLMSRMKA